MEQQISDLKDYIILLKSEIRNLEDIITDKDVLISDYKDQLEKRIGGLND